MVGEIRDLETAEIAVQASLTGHLVLSTLHTNTAIGAVTRLRDMGIEPFLLASSLIGVLAQRLVRLLCPACKTRWQGPPSELNLLTIPQDAAPRLYQAAGCSACKNSGYRGRTSIYELVLVDDEFRRMIHDGVGEHELVGRARIRTRSLKDCGKDKILAGITSPEEVLRIIREG
jgi:general secretion pathway protein E